MNRCLNQTRRIELLAPAGDFDSLKSAIGNGADSVYIGATMFNARKKAKNFSDEELFAAIDYAHIRSCKIYLALNILLTDTELELAYYTAEQAWEYGVDAIIVQDIGFAGMLKKRIPGVILHASTQSTIYDEYAIDACSEIGFSRIILPRELSLSDIKRLTEYANSKGIETEVFAHGALCVCYSGQCVMSSTLGGRSGNRGECAQPCRLSYDLAIDGKTINDSEPRLGTKDITAIEHIDELINAGVSALKIEGRMRSAEYVGIVTGEFNSLIDKTNDDNNDTIMNLLLAFNRGGSFSDNYLRGEKGPDMIAGPKPGSYGILIGSITATNPRLGIVEISPEKVCTDSIQKLNCFVEKGDIVAVRKGIKDEEIANAPIGEVTDSSSGLRIKGFHPDVITKFTQGDKVYRMTGSKLSAKALTADLGRTCVSGTFGGDADGLFLSWQVISGISKGFSIRHFMAITDAEISNLNNYSAITEDRCKTQLAKTGDFPLLVNDIEVEFLPSIPVSVLNKIRRDSMSELCTKLAASFRREKNITLNTDDVVSRKQKLNKEEIFQLIDGIDAYASKVPLSNVVSDEVRSNLISVYLYNWDKTAEGLDCGADILELPIWNFFCETAFASVRQFRETNKNTKIVIALPPAFTGFKYSEMRKILAESAKQGFDGVLSGNPGNHFLCNELGLTDMRDSSSNVFNSESSDYIRNSGSFSLMPSVELAFDPIIKIMVNAGRQNDFYFELPAYGRARLMYTEHCPVGYNKSGCRMCSLGRSYSLKDRKRAMFPIICHSETCTAEILNSDILCAPEEIRKLSSINPIIARLSFTVEDVATRTELVALFRKLISGNIDSDFLPSSITDIKKIASSIAIAHGNAVTAGNYTRGIV